MNDSIIVEYLAPNQEKKLQLNGMIRKHSVSELRILSLSSILLLLTMAKASRSEWKELVWASETQKTTFSSDVCRAENCANALLTSRKKKTREDALRAPTLSQSAATIFLCCFSSSLSFCHFFLFFPLFSTSVCNFTHVMMLTPVFRRR